MRIMVTATRGFALLVVLAGGVALTWRWGAADRAAALGSRPTLAELIAGAAGVVLPLALAWLVVLVVLVLAEPAVGRELTTLAGCPPALRRLLLTLVGVAVAGAMAVPAQAMPSRTDGSPAGPGEVSRSQTVPGLLDGLPLPERPAGAAPGQPVSTARTAGLARPAAVSEEDRTITVRPGDSLWRLAEQRLPDASDQEVARAVGRLYAANRDRIGSDPDLIHPGTTLRSTLGPSGDADDSQEDLS